MRRDLLLALSLTLPLGFIAAPASTAQDASARAVTESSALWPEIRREGIENSKVMRYLDELTNGIGHRLTGSDNYTLACRWAKERFEAMGLEVKLEPWATWNFVFNRGQWTGRMNSPEKVELQVATEAWTAGTRGAITGPAVRLARMSIAAIEDLAGQVDGAWIFTRKPRRRSDPAWAHLMDFADTEGVAGIVYPSSGDAKYPNRIRVFGSRNMALKANSKIPTMPQICVRKDQWTSIDKRLQNGEKVELTFDIRNRFRREEVVINNVIADLKGVEKPDEMVIVCGHLDSWHQATGTTDNGTGTTSTMEAARILSAVGARPRRTIRFILWGGEEQGLLGSREYVKRHRKQLAKVSAVFNHDTGTNWAQSLGVPADMLEDFQKVVAPLAQLPAPDKDWKGDVFRLGKLRSMRGGRGGSDHASFLAADIPAWSWGLKGRSNYFQHTWHSQWDTYDVAIPEYQRHTSTVVATIALGVANLPNLLCRDSVGRNVARTRAKQEASKPAAETKKKDANSEKKTGETGTSTRRRRG